MGDENAELRRQSLLIAIGCVIGDGAPFLLVAAQHPFHPAMVVAGLAILVYRRRTTGPVFSATTVNDKVMYLVLGLTILFGMWNTISTAFAPEDYHYREGVSPWFRSIFAFQPNVDLIAGAPFQVRNYGVADAAVALRGSVMDRNLTRAERPWWHRKK